MGKRVAGKKLKVVPNLDSGQSLTISDFCALERISRRTFYNLLEQGQAPEFYKVGFHLRITPQAHAEWRRQREADHEAREYRRCKRRFANVGGAPS
jgi:hypothetical protein